MSAILNSISFETVVIYVILTISAIIWAFLKMKKNDSDDCSRVILLSFIPLLASTAFASYCFQKNIGEFAERISSILLYICIAAVFVTVAIAAFVSYRRKGIYYETLKERKPILVMCGVVLIIGIVLIFCAKFFM